MDTTKGGRTAFPSSSLPSPPCPLVLWVSRGLPGLRFVEVVLSEPPLGKRIGRPMSVLGPWLCMQRGLGALPLVLNLDIFEETE